MADNNTLNGALMKLGETMAGNLEAMGVTDASPNDGLTTLAGKILTVEPSISGLNLDTSLVITTTQEIIGLGESIILTSTLRASYDDTTVVDVDLSGVLTGATVKFYNGTTLLGTAITDLNGIATYTYTPSQLGNFTFNAVFEGTENFTNCTSNNMNITVINAPTSLVLQADKSILSNYDNDNCTLTATLYDNNNTPMEGLNVVFKNGDIVLATITTDSGGVATYTYNSQGVGDVTITAECMNLTKTYTLEDCNYYSETGTTLIQNDSTDSGYPSDIPYHHEGTEKYMVEFDFTMRTQFRFYYVSTEVTSKGDPQHYGYGFSRDASGKFVITTRTTTSSNSTYTTGLSNGEERRIKMIIDGTTVSFYDNGNLIRTQTNDWLTTNPPAYFSWSTWGTGTVTVKNIKIKPL